MVYVVCGIVLVLGSLAARGWPVTPWVPEDDERWFDGQPLDPRAVAYLRAGRYGVVLTVLAELHARGAVDAGRRVRPVGPLPPAGHDDPRPPVGHDDPRPRAGYDDALARAVYAGATWCSEPRVIAALPPVRRATHDLRTDLVGRGLRTPPRRTLLAWALLGYAAGLVVAGVFESGRTLSTVVGAAAVLAASAVATVGPRRTVAGQRVLRAERRLLGGWVSARAAEPGQLLAAMVAAHGRGALELLCTRFVPVGALAPAADRPAADRPAVDRPAPVAPAFVPVSLRAVVAGPRRPVYEPVADGPAITVRPAFLPTDRVAA